VTTMSGLSETTARALVAEIGTDMTRFPSVAHPISWAGFCPRTKARADDAPRVRERVARAQTDADQRRPDHKKDGYLRAQFLRI